MQIVFLVWFLKRAWATCDRDGRSAATGKKEARGPQRESHKRAEKRVVFEQILLKHRSLISHKNSRHSINQSNAKLITTCAPAFSRAAISSLRVFVCLFCFAHSFTLVKVSLPF